MTPENERILTGRFEGVREAVRPYWIRLAVFYVRHVTVLRLFGWKCCFLRAIAGIVRSPFQVPSEPACAWSDLSLQTPFDRPSSLAHFKERLGFIG